MMALGSSLCGAVYLDLKLNIPMGGLTTGGLTRGGGLGCLGRLKTHDDEAVKKV